MINSLNVLNVEYVKRFLIVQFYLQVFNKLVFIKIGGVIKEIRYFEVFQVEGYKFFCDFDESQRLCFQKNVYVFVYLIDMILGN